MGTATHARYGRLGTMCVPVLTGTLPHRAGRYGGSAARNLAESGAAEADADDEAPGSRRPGRALTSQRSLRKKPHPCHIDPAAKGSGAGPGRGGEVQGTAGTEVPPPSGPACLTG